MTAPEARIAPLPATRLAIDLRRPAGAAIAALLLRLLFGLFALPISATFPETSLEKQIGLLPGSTPLGIWLQRVAVEPWVRYDAWNYIRIVDHGYRVEEGTAAFHPLYPLISAPFALLLGNAPLALLIVATLATISATVIFARYVERFHGADLAVPAAAALLLAPPSFIMLAPYNEGLFLLLAVGCLWATREQRWWLAGTLGGLACLTRQQGLALALPLAWALLVALRERRVRWWQLAAVGLVPLGYALFVAYRAVALGDLARLAGASSPADFLRGLLVSSSSEQVVTGQRIAWPWEPLIDQVRLLFSKPNSYHLAMDLLLGYAMLVVVALGWRSMDALERLYCAGIITLSLGYYNGVLDPYLSLPRHMLLAFPLYVALARMLGTGMRRRYGMYALLLLNAFLAGAFIRHGWVP
ncbi:hypothetical protein EKD04_002980 [Chloroflexales bacterium ZM16-3]|nr:hypothetical protein [Chloroflexales bacterium ZM16-3]